MMMVTMMMLTMMVTTIMTTTSVGNEDGDGNDEDVKLRLLLYQCLKNVVLYLNTIIHSHPFRLEVAKLTYFICQKLFKTLEELLK